MSDKIDQTKLTTGGIIVFAFVLWSTAVNGSPETRKMINYFLFVLLTSIVMIRWKLIAPLLFKTPE